MTYLFCIARLQATEQLFIFSQGDDHEAIMAETYDHRWLAPVLFIAWAFTGLIVTSWGTAFMFDAYFEAQRILAAHQRTWIPIQPVTRLLSLDNAFPPIIGRCLPPVHCCPPGV